MRIKSQLYEKCMESLGSILPILVIVLLLSITIAPLSSGVFLMFFLGALLIALGMALFEIGVDLSLIPMGEGIGITLSKTRRKIIPLIVCFVLGALVTAAEPDLSVLASQVPSVPDMTLILAVSAGVGIFLVIARLRILFRIPLSRLLMFFYTLVLILAFCVPESFIAVSFDSGGVTTGPMTVPFILALGIGMASMRSDKDSGKDSFGLVSLCSIGPILSVMILGICYQPDGTVYSSAEILYAETTKEAAAAFGSQFAAYGREVCISLLPLLGVLLLYQVIFRRFSKYQLLQILIGFMYTSAGLLLFLTGANVGFVPAGQVIGSMVADGNTRNLLIPVGMVIGYFIVRAEPAVQVLTRQVEEISNGSISRGMIGQALSIGVAISVALSMLRILTGISVLWFLVPGYAAALILTFFVPPIYTGIAFDSGGVASGTMTATFLLPFAMGACESVGGNILTDAFGCVAYVAMTPLITIQCLGLYEKWKRQSKRRRFQTQLESCEDIILYYDEPDTFEGGIKV